MRRLLGALALVTTLVASAGCSSDDDLPPEGLAKCENVWVVGQTLPKDYQGCSNGPTITVAPDQQECDSGAPLVTYEAGLVARLGGIIETGDSTSCH